MRTEEIENDHFVPLGVIVCVNCSAHNLSWSMGCWECGSPLFNEDDDIADHHKQENAA